ncbi:geranylgeranyl reductase family protein [Natronorubrum bangense]|uniref:Geranylgeranyl reductase n=2 Tax=Natronorubrum bangense TaxID=61858 RepID=L9WH52_9EURY|nr:geranylgeranyl reductase family protein [Natronorubrum bangense]ELY48682.1 geranylgeranyl reductase [Natronorubrum bangense JCM 10635]QCC53922.1 geranylgeranyl reductase family protein [Natronorubrum bangense]
MYDFVVVGVGPAGARFSRRAAEQGYDVLALEKGTVGTPLACSGHVSTDIWAFTGERAREELFQNEIYGARFHVGGPHSTAYPFYKDDVASNVIDRVGLDRHLADLAREAGADVRESHTVTEVTEHDDHVTVVVNGPDGTLEFEGKMLAGCDGPRSRVREALSLPEPDELLHGVLAFSDEVDHENFVDVHLTAPTFFAWRIPRGEAGVEYGLAAPPGVQVTKHFEELIDGYEIDVAHRCSGAIPIGPPSRVTSRRAFLIGDAAAQTKPFTGGGILYGMTCADHAAREINPDRPATLAAYERAWRDDLEREMELGHSLRRAYSFPEPVQRVGLNALSGEIGVHMDRPTSLVSPSHLKAMLSRLRPSR